MEALRAAEKIHRAAHIERDDRWQLQPALVGRRTYEIAGRKKTERSEYTGHGSEREGILSCSQGRTGEGKRFFGPFDANRLGSGIYHFGSGKSDPTIRLGN
ncbi:hypothetical protein BHE74_00012171 [Ensete ventricosum]|nr:hypothetical protein BHE74_00012171 [Ensete ventricosum]